MSERPDCIHHLDLCPTCDGLRVTRLERVEGVTSISVDVEGTYLFDGALTLGGVTDLYIGPVAEDCAKRTEQPNVRLIDGRRMQCKDIPDDVFLDAVRRSPGTSSQNWRMRWDVHAELEEAVGPVPEKLLLAKARKLIGAGKMGGCDCGCRGDWHLSDECDAHNCCHPR